MRILRFALNQNTTTIYAPADAKVILVSGDLASLSVRFEVPDSHHQLAHIAWNFWVADDLSIIPDEAEHVHSWEQGGQAWHLYRL